MATDQNNKGVTFVESDNGVKVQLLCDESTDELVIKMFSSSSSTKGVKQIDQNYKPVDFVEDSTGGLSPLMCDDTGRLYIDSSGLTKI